MTREDLADLSGLSVDSLRSYELGRRHPTREYLARLLECLHVDEHSRNLILVGAGYASEAPVERLREPNIATREAVRLVRARSFPTFLLNPRAEILAVNAAAWRLVGLPDRELKPSSRRSILTMATRRAIAAHAANWDELAAGMISTFKAAVPEEPSVDAPGPYLALVLKQLCAGDAALITRFFDLWETTPAFEGRMTGNSYEVVWNTTEGHIRFSCLVNCLNTDVGLYAHSWMPADATSHVLFEQLLASEPPS